MKLRTLCLSPGRIVPGMQVAKNITDRDGNTLLSAGTLLDTHMLDGLIRRGVETVHVLVADSRSEATIAEDRETARRRVETIFRGAGSAAREELRNAVLAYRLEGAK